MVFKECTINKWYNFGWACLLAESGRVADYFFNDA